MKEISHAEWRRARVKRLKRMLVAGFFVVVTVPLALSIYLGCRLHITEKKLAEITALYESLTENGETTVITPRNNHSIADGNGEILNMESGGTAADFYEDSYHEVLYPDDGIPAGADDSSGETEVYTEDPEGDFTNPDEPRRVYLTFDDGPSIHTGEILDILDTYGVKATFFVTGFQAEEHPELYQEIVNRGHVLAMHTFTHVYKDIYKDKDNFIKDFTALKNYIRTTTGREPEFYRFPGGSSNKVSRTSMEELCRYVESTGMTYFDWNVSAGDAEKPAPGREKIINNCINGIEKRGNSIVLLHDSGARTATMEALPELIERIQAMENTVILPISKDTEIIQHKKTDKAEDF